MLLSDIAARFGLTLVGEDADIVGLSTLEAAGPGDLTFLASARYADQLAMTKAAAVIVPPAFADKVARGLVTDNPYLAVARIAATFAKPQGEFTGVSPLAFVADSATVGAGVDIGPFAYVGPRAEIGPGCRVFPNAYVGEDCRLGPGCILYPTAALLAGTVIGSGVIIHAGAVLGADGFGFAQGPEGFVKIPQTGTVKIGDRVEIGANTCIDRAARDKTVVGDGTKIDNLCQVAHNVTIGQHSIMVSQVGISGSTKVGRGVLMGGQAGITGHLTLGDGCQIGAQAGVTKDVAPGAKILGSPAIEAQSFLRAAVTFPKLPEMSRRLKALERELAALRNELAGGGET